MGRRRFPFSVFRETHHARLLQQQIPSVPQVNSASGRGVFNDFTIRQNLDPRWRALGFLEQPAAFRRQGVSVGEFGANMATAVALGFLGVNVDLIDTVDTVDSVTS